MVASPAPRSLLAPAAATAAIALLAACSATPPPEAAGPRCAEPVAGKVVCPPGTERDGDNCYRTDVLTVVKCPAGSHLEDGECLREILTNCPAGMTFQPGTGCVPVVAIDPAAGAGVPGGLTGAPGKPKSGCPAGMALIAGGSFALGGYAKSAGTTTTVTTFCIDLTEVTVGAFRACVKKGTCSDAKLICNPGSSSWAGGDDQLPLNCVDYAESATYCGFAGKRLVTEDEWEWSARGGALARKYPWGASESWSNVCASKPNKRTLPCRVGSFASGDSPQGVHDLAGNLWEWTKSPRPDDNSDPLDQAIRGGGWDIMGSFRSFTADSRVSYEPTYRSKAVGFRCAKNL
jgi:hypothetical protein